MSSLTYRSPQLPWADNKQEHLFKIILIVFLSVTLIMGVIVPNISLPKIEREKLEKVPAQLAKVIKRKKEAPKPKPKPKVIEKKIEKKPEVKKEVVKAKPTPKVVAKPKPKPKPKRVAKKERTPDRIKAAKAKAKKLIANFSNDLADMQSMLDMSSLTVDSASLNNDGSAATDVGDVVDQTAVNRIGGIDESSLTRSTGAEQLAEANRDTTEVKELAKDVMAEAPQDKRLAGMSRSQMQINRVFERNLSRFTRIYKKALRSNPALEGTVTLGVTIAASGDVSSCKINASDLQDKKVEKRMIMTCKMLSFDTSKSEDKFEFPLTFAP